MAKKLYVGNLSFNTTDQDLVTAFSEIGNVASARIIIDRESGRSKGFGFVEMEQDNDALTAASELNGKQFMGRALTVNEARPREEGGAPNRFGGRGGYDNARG